MDPIVGIDLGTSNTVVAYAEPAGAKVLADESSFKIHPSVVSFHPNGGVVVGAAAKQRKVIDPKNTIFSVKRLIGRSYDSREVQTAKPRMPYQIKEGPNHLPIIVTRGGEFAVPEISAIVLDHMKNVASGALGTPVSRAVVTVPATFNDAQRSATATAGAIAGLTVLRVLNEPTAAALAYGNAKDLRQTIAVYDFGGGTFDITILKLDDQVYEVLGTAGDTFLGGDDLDERLVDRMVEKFLAENRIDLRDNEVSMMRLRAVAEQTKIELSRRSRAVVRIDEIAYGAKGKPLNLQVEVTRDEFVAQVADIIDRTFPVVREALTLAGLDTRRIDDVLLVGGTTKIPYVRDQVTKFFGKAPRTDVNPEEAVASGAALQALALDRVLKRPSSKSNVPVPIGEFVDDAPTREGNDLDAALNFVTTETEPTETTKTTPKREMPMPQVEDELSELTFETPKRPTNSYGMARTVTGERAPARGAQVDRLEVDRASQERERTPPPQATPLGRITKPAQPPPMTTMIGVPSAPSPQTAPPAPRTDRSVPISRPPASPPAIALPPLAAPPMPPPPVPSASPQARTIMLDPAQSPPMARTMLDPAASSTAPGMGPADTLETAAASTAKGFTPPAAYPQTYPVMPTRPAPVVLDVTPRGLGIGTVAGYCEELIRRNARVPTETRKLFTTSRDRQDVVHIIVCQGESRRLDDNIVIGDLRLDNLPPRERGETSIEVTFMLDASGILQVRARDAQTGREQRATLDLVGSVPDADVASSRNRVQALRR